jgi:hypothetical protein
MVISYIDTAANAPLIRLIRTPLLNVSLELC